MTDRSASAGADTANASRTHSLIASDKVEGTTIRRSNGDKLGTIDRLMIEKVSGQVAYVVMSFGGFLGIAEDEFTLPWRALHYNPSLDAYELNLSDDQLRNVPRGTVTGADPSADQAWEEHVHHYFNQAVFDGEALPKATHEAKGGREP